MSMQVVQERVEAPTVARRALEILAREHANISMLLVMLESYFAAMKAGEEVDDQLLLDAMTYLTDFFDRYHHTKEELAVEASADRSRDIEAFRPELTAQHERLRVAGERLREGLERVLLDAPTPRRELADAGFAYTAELRRHMLVEETVVFPALAEALDAAAWGRIDARIGPEHDPLFGDVVHERYVNLFRELTSRFGVDDVVLE